MTTTDFKKGDLVRRTEPWPGASPHHEAPVKGRLYTVSEVEPFGPWIGLEQIDTGHDRTPFFAGAFELYEFQVGDKVNAYEGSIDWEEHYDWAKGRTVIGVDRFGNVMADEAYAFNADVLTPAAKTAAVTSAVGDLRRVTDPDDRGAHGFREGTVGRVILAREYDLPERGVMHYLITTNPEQGEETQDTYFDAWRNGVTAWVNDRDSVPQDPTKFEPGDKVWSNLDSQGYAGLTGVVSEDQTKSAFLDHTRAHGFGDTDTVTHAAGLFAPGELFHAATQRISEDAQAFEIDGWVDISPYVEAVEFTPEFAPTPTRDVAFRAGDKVVATMETDDWGPKKNGAILTVKRVTPVQPWGGPYLYLTDESSEAAGVLPESGWSATRFGLAPEAPATKFTAGDKIVVVGGESTEYEPKKNGAVLTVDSIMEEQTYGGPYVVLTPGSATRAGLTPDGAGGWDFSRFEHLDTLVASGEYLELRNFRGEVVKVVQEDPEPERRTPTTPGSVIQYETFNEVRVAILTPDGKRWKWLLVDGVPAHPDAGNTADFVEKAHSTYWGIKVLHDAGAGD